jgi:glycosyltransferase involved in cell wall biosynthesis
VKTEKRKFTLTYFVLSYGSQTSGVYKKIADQVKEWDKLHLDFQLCVITDQPSYEDWAKISQNAQVFVDKTGPLRFLSRSLIFWKAVGLTTDLVYVRETFPLFFLKIKRRPTLILEIQTIQSQELRNRSKIKWLLYLLAEKFWIKNFSFNIFVSNEIRDILTSGVSRQKSYVISNGIDVSNLKVLADVNIEKGPNYFFIGSLDQPWQGTEQLFDLARQLPKSVFHIVGKGAPTTGSPSNVVLHGELTAEQYFPIAESCSVAFSTLGQNITGMSEASPLKSREYLAMGLPVIGRYLDTDLSRDYDFYLELPCDTRPLTDFINEIVDFTTKWHGRRVPRGEIVNLIGSAQKERQRLQIFEQVISRNL